MFPDSYIFTNLLMYKFLTSTDDEYESGFVRSHMFEVC